MSGRTLESWLRIPREYARFDLAIAELYPRIRWLDTVDGERAERSSAMRMARAIFSRESSWSVARRAVVAGARLAFGMGQRAAALKALSLVYDIEYGLARALLAAGDRGHAPNQVTAAECAVTVRPPALHGDGRNS